MQVQFQLHASVFRQSYRQNQALLNHQKMTISQKIKSDLIPFFFRFNPFFSGKKYTKKRKGKKRKAKEISLTPFKKRNTCGNSFLLKKTEQKKRLKTVAFRPLFHYLCKLRIDKFNYKDERYQNKRTGRKQKELELH